MPNKANSADAKNRAIDEQRYALPDTLNGQPLQPMIKYM